MLWLLTSRLAEKHAAQKDVQTLTHLAVVLLVALLQTSLHAGGTPRTVAVQLPGTGGQQAVQPQAVLRPDMQAVQHRGTETVQHLAMACQLAVQAVRVQLLASLAAVAVLPARVEKST